MSNKESAILTILDVLKNYANRNDIQLAEIKAEIKAVKTDMHEVACDLRGIGDQMITKNYLDKKLTEFRDEFASDISTC
ncbi:MAG: hypothetical protein HZC26_03845 [Candidatus Magasanikbacteria bacterium]|nr:hypothetical protein [Candidatus Magasanikbacteria bacterium]